MRDVRYGNEGINKDIQATHKIRRIKPTTNLTTYMRNNKKKSWLVATTLPMKKPTAMLV